MARRLRTGLLENVCPGLVAQLRQHGGGGYECTSGLWVTPDNGHAPVPRPSPRAGDHAEQAQPHRAEPVRNKIQYKHEPRAWPECERRPDGRRGWRSAFARCGRSAHASNHKTFRRGSPRPEPPRRAPTRPVVGTFSLLKPMPPPFWGCCGSAQKSSSREVLATWCRRARRRGRPPANKAGTFNRPSLLFPGDRGVFCPTVLVCRSSRTATIDLRTSIRLFSERPRGPASKTRGSSATLPYSNRKRTSSLRRPNPW